MYYIYIYIYISDFHYLDLIVSRSLRSLTNYKPDPNDLARTHKNYLTQLVNTHGSSNQNIGYICYQFCSSSSALIVVGGPTSNITRSELYNLYIPMICSWKIRSCTNGVKSLKEFVWNFLYITPLASSR